MLPILSHQVSSEVKTFYNWSLGSDVVNITHHFGEHGIRYFWGDPMSGFDLYAVLFLKLVNFVKHLVDITFESFFNNLVHLFL